MKQIFPKILSASCVAALCLGSAQANDANDSGAMIVLDASGSMWGEVGDKHKIEIARNVIGDTVKDWNAATDLGLIAYGHNRKGDCDDIEVLIEPGKVDADIFNAKTIALNPKGKTPLTAAVIKAAETLKYKEEKATVILVSDGKETCNLDPCAVGKKLEEIGVDFTAHIISFDVPKEETAGLQCLAEATGGMFIEAKNAGDLKEAMKDTRELVTDKEEPKLAKATLEAPAEIPAGSKFKVKWTGPKNRHDYIIIRTPDRENKFGYAYVGSEKDVSPATLKAPETSGDYTLFYEVDKDTPLGQTNIKVIPVTATLDAPETVPAGSEFKVTWTGPGNEFDNIRIFSADGEKSFDRAYAFDDYESPAKLTAPEDEGTYEIRFLTHKKNVLATHKFQVTPVSASLKAPETVPAGSKFKVEWTGPENKFDNIRIYTVDGEKSLGRAYAFGDYQSPATLTAPEKPGTYEVRFLTHEKNMLARQTFEVTAVTASLDGPKTVPAGSKFKVNWTGPGNKFDNIRIFSADGEKKYSKTYAFDDYKNPAELTAPEDAGTYELRFLTHIKNILARQTFEVTPVTATLKAPKSVNAGEKFQVEWAGPNNKFDNIRIFSAEGEKKYNMAYAFDNYTSPSELTAPKEPGEYEIRFLTHGKKILAKVPLTVK